VVAEDGDCDGVLTADDCDDTDATMPNDDADCDGVLTVDDCDDTDPFSTVVADDGDCDGVPTADDCDDADDTLLAVADDGDCDGALTADDCDDADNTLLAVADDGDCDGVLSADDCDDADPFSLVVADDGDCDGAITADDCDDGDPTSTILVEDADCDGVLTAADCDDSNASMPVDDADCDGVKTSSDCDDTNPVVPLAGDVDCDGIVDEWTFEGEDDFAHACGQDSGDSWVACDWMCSAGNVAFMNGPYTNDLTQGDYKAVWTIKTDDQDTSSLDVLTLDVAKNPGTNVVESRTINRSSFSSTGTWYTFFLNFSYNGSGSLEFRTKYANSHRACFWVDKVEVSRR
jgi:hypothetical protein